MGWGEFFLEAHFALRMYYVYRYEPILGSTNPLETASEVFVHQIGL